MYDCSIRCALNTCVVIYNTKSVLYNFQFVITFEFFGLTVNIEHHVQLKEKRNNVLAQ